MTRKANHKKLFSKTDCASKVISTISYTYLSSIKNKKCLEHHFVFKISWFCQSFSMFAFVVQMLNQWILFGLLQEGNGIRTLESFCLREEERLDEFFEKKTSIAKGSSIVSLATNSREPFTRFILGGFFSGQINLVLHRFGDTFLNHHELYTSWFMRKIIEFTFQCISLSIFPIRLIWKLAFFWRSSIHLNTLWTYLDMEDPKEKDYSFKNQDDSGGKTSYLIWWRLLLQSHNLDGQLPKQTFQHRAVGLG